MIIEDDDDAISFSIQCDNSGHQFISFMTSAPWVREEQILVTSADKEAELLLIWES